MKYGIEIVEEYLKKNGLCFWNGGECACRPGDLAPCDAMDCEVAHANECINCAKRGAEECDINSADEVWVAREIKCFVAKQKAGDLSDESRQE